MRSPNSRRIYLPLRLAFHFLLFLLFCTITHQASAQRPSYKIEATLDTITYSLDCRMEITYTNPSAHPLDSIGIHLWANAYKSNHTALNHQKLHQGDLSLHRAKKEDRGGFYSLTFTSPDQPVSLKEEVDHIDIGWLILTKPLLPGQTIQLSSTFTVDIPKSFSRIGRTGRSYQVTQWYPHIAVLNEDGWHTMPYLDQGEFFNDFADYEVTIHAPSSYKIAATGSMVTTEEMDSVTTHIYKADNVIDFAWFASPTFTHQMKMVDVRGPSPVALNVFIDEIYKPHWDSAMIMAERALQFYSDWLGPYPYPQMTVVSTPFSRAGYMEYPMVAQISFTDDAQLLDRVIAHEIGHTWLYAILANDERTHPWMDEGFNSFIEDEYMHAFYGTPEEILFPRVVHHHHSMSHYDALQHMVRAAGNLQPPYTSPVWQHNDQYILSAYTLPAQGLKLIQASVGKEMMKNMFRNYFLEHQFTHVSPEDVETSFESTCQCDLSWFFDDWLHRAHELDYVIKSFKPKQQLVTIENKGPVFPIRISEYANGTQVKDYVIPGFEGEKELTVTSGTEQVRIYEGLMGANRQWCRNVKPQNHTALIGIVPKIGNYDRPTLAFTPIIGYNLADGGLPGIIVTSDLLPQPNFKMVLMPMYGLESKEFRFFGEGRYTGDIKGNLFDKFILGLTGSSFGYHVDTHYLFRDYYERLSPFIGMRMDQPGHSHVAKWWKYRYVNITQVYGRGTNYDEYEYVEEKRDYGVHELSFQISSDTVLQPYTATASLQAGKGFARINLHYRQHLRGKDKMTGIWVHGFAGFLPVYKDPDANVLFSFNGISSNGFFSRDYMFDEWLPGRNAVDGNISRQVFMKDAGLKTLSTIGISDNWMIGGGTSVALPFKVIHLYMDAALYDSGITEEVAFSYSGGLAIVLMKDVFEIYIPVLESKDIRESLTYDIRDQWYDRISFQANFKLGNPLALVDKYQFKF